MEVRVERVSSLPSNFETLISESKLEGHKFVEKTKDEWDFGENNFSGDGEAFFLVYEKDQLVGCGGVNVDPYTDNSTFGRIRHLYVRPSFRRQGVAKKLLVEIINYSRASFSVLRLRANSIDKGSHKFYVACGFSSSQGDKYETHRLLL